MIGKSGWQALVAGALAMATGASMAQTATPAPSAAPAAEATVELPRDQNVLFWTQAQRDLAFRMFDTVTPASTIRAGTTPLALPEGRPLRGEAGEGPEMTVESLAALGVRRVSTGGALAAAAWKGFDAAAKRLAEEGRI